MTGPDPAQKKPTRSTSSRAKTPKPDPLADASSDPLTGFESISPVEPVTPEVAAAEVVAEPVVVAAPAPEASAMDVPEPAQVAETPSVATPSVAAPSVAEAPAVPPMAAPPAVPPMAAPPAEPAAPASGAAGSEPAAAASAAGAGAAAGKLSTPDIAGAVDKAVDRLRTHLTVGEIVAGLGAVIILGISWLTFGFIFGHYGTWPSQLVMLLCVAMLAALILDNAHIHDFGPSYRVIIAGICFALGILATLSFLQEFRLLFNGRSFDIGGLTWWAGAWISVIGGFLVWREGR